MSGSPWYLLGVGEYIFEYDIYTICEVHRGVFQGVGEYIFEYDIFTICQVHRGIC